MSVKAKTIRASIGLSALKGDKGDPGESAYQVSVDNGFEGTEEEWLASLKADFPLADRMAKGSGYNAVIIGDTRNSDRFGNKATGMFAMAEGGTTEASGDSSHSEGIRSKASGSGSHSEGYETIANAPDAHSEGRETTASGTQSHAEGYKTTASGYYAHSEGLLTEASGSYAHAEGLGCVGSPPSTGRVNRLRTLRFWAISV